MLFCAGSAGFVRGIWVDISVEDLPHSPSMEGPLGRAIMRRVTHASTPAPPRRKGATNRLPYLNLIVNY